MNIDQVSYLCSSAGPVVRCCYWYSGHRQSIWIISERLWPPQLVNQSYLTDNYVTYVCMLCDLQLLDICARLWWLPGPSSSAYSGESIM